MFSEGNKKLVRRPVPEDTGLFDVGLNGLLRRIYLARDVVSQQQLDKSLSGLPDPKLLKGIDEAVALLLKARSSESNILIVGDFDADGATSCSVAILGFKALGFSRVDYLVPNRFEYGYGLTPEIVDEALKKKPDLIVTVDNGISSHEGIERARQSGCRVLVTDHHLPGETLPHADAIVNPNQPGDQFPSKNIAGVGVLFYLLLALRAEMRDRSLFDAQNISPPNLANLLDLVALGTVADVVRLDRVNRALVHQGLLRIRAGKTRPGILALLQVAKRNPETVKASDFGFAVGPRLNAAGRLDDMSLGIECLLSDDESTALQMATQLDELNRSRREIEEGMKSEALSMMEVSSRRLEKTVPFGVCLFEPQWHQGVIGILAARIKEKFHRPTIVFAQADENEIKGSARSIPGIHIRDVLSEIAAANPAMLDKFGGHAMAAGLTIKQKDFEQFSTLFDQTVKAHLDGCEPELLIETDGELNADDLSLDTAEMLQSGGPWGQGFPEPIFQGVFEVVQARVVAEKHLKLMLKHSDSRYPVDAIAFFVEEPQSWIGELKLNVAYQLDINEYRGVRTVQLLVRHLERVTSG